MSFATDWAEELQTYGRVGTIKKPGRGFASGTKNPVATMTTLAVDVTALVLNQSPSRSLVDVIIGKSTIGAKFFAIAGVSGIEDGCLWVEGAEPDQKTSVLRYVEVLVDEGETITTARLEEKVT